MKNKRTTYLLLAVVAGIWGLIGWKVWKGLQGDEDAVFVNEPTLSATKKKSSTDTFELIANYRDPFLGKSATPEKLNTTVQSSGVPKIAAVLPKQQPTAPAWPEIRYGGFVKKTGQENAAGFLVINGNTEIMKQGQQAQNVTVVQLWRDSVEVLYNKERRIIRK